MTEERSSRLLVTIMMTVFFSGLALDIAVPALVLTFLAVLRWLGTLQLTVNDSLFARKAETT